MGGLVSKAEHQIDMPLIKGHGTDGSAIYLSLPLIAHSLARVCVKIKKRKKNKKKGRQKHMHGYAYAEVPLSRY